MLRLRLITGPLLVMALLALLWADGLAADAVRAAGGGGLLGSPDGIVLAAFVALVLAPVLAAELARMLRGAGIAAPTWLTVAAAVAGVLAMRAAPALPGPAQAAAAVAVAAWAVLAAALVVHTRGARIEGSVAAAGGTLLAFAYVGVMLGILLLARCEAGPWVLAGAILTVKAGDIGAYAAGMSLGRHKMIPWLSPAKSWEGLAGGIALACATGAALAWWSGSLADPRDQVPAALGAVGTFGDLAESLLKRSAGLKDSGSILPGMGGALDVLDSPMLAGPVIWIALQLRGT